MRGKKAKALRRQIYKGGDFRERELFGIDRSRIVAVFDKDGKEKNVKVQRFQAVADESRFKYQHAKK